MKQVYLLVLSSLFFISCNHENNTHRNALAKSSAATETSLTKDSASQWITNLQVIKSPVPKGYYAYKKDSAQVSQYIRRIFQDSKGNIWFGTNDDGVCRYDGKSLTYFTTNERFAGNAVRGIVEDKFGNIWFATSGGVCKFDGASLPTGQAGFTTFSEGLTNLDCWSILIDTKGTLWVSTYEGVCSVNLNELLGQRKSFTSFTIPEPTERDPMRNISPKLVRSIIEDKAGNIWFGTNGGGAYRYDGISLINISKKDGLNDNFVDCILQDKRGDLWFSSHFKGITRYDGKSFYSFSEKEGLGGNQVWDLYEDKKGNIWCAANGYGVYRYTEGKFTNFNQKDGLTNLSVQSIYEDKSGILWFGSGAGLFRFDGKAFFNITKEDAWPKIN